MHSDSCHANTVLASAKAEGQGESEATHSGIHRARVSTCTALLYIPAIFARQPCCLVTVRLRNLWYLKIQKNNLSESDKKVNLENDTFCFTSKSFRLTFSFFLNKVVFLKHSVHLVVRCDLPHRLHQGQSWEVLGPGGRQRG